MSKGNPRIDMIYKTKDYVGEEVYAYIRAWQGNEVGFSVIDKAMSNPDLSCCGLFWVAPEHFWFLFEEFKPKAAL